MSIPAKKRRQHATVKVNGESKYPIFDRHSAESAVKLRNSAKPDLTPAQKAAVLRKAAKYGVKPATSKKGGSPSKKV